MIALQCLHSNMIFPYFLLTLSKSKKSQPLQPLQAETLEDPHLSVCCRPGLPNDIKWIGGLKEVAPCLDSCLRGFSRE